LVYKCLIQKETPPHSADLLIQLHVPVKENRDAEQNSKTNLSRENSENEKTCNTENKEKTKGMIVML
jgi:hypothetical protein